MAYSKSIHIVFPEKKWNEIAILAQAYKMSKTQVIKDAVNYALFKHLDEAKQSLIKRGITPETL